MLAAGVGIWRFHSARLGAAVLGPLAILVGVVHLAGWSPFSLVMPAPGAGESASSASLAELAWFFLEVGALTFGGGLSMIAFIQEQVVNQYHWITPQEFLGGLALGQLTPGPVVVVATYVGYKVAGLGGALVAELAIFLPSFVLTLAVLPVFERFRALAWGRAAVQGVGPAVIAVLAVSLVRLAPYALPDPFAVVILAGTLGALLVRRVGPLKLVLAGGALGVLRSRLSPVLGASAPV